MNRSKPPTVLLSSVCRPFGSKAGDSFGVSAEGSHQLMWAQGVFRPRATTNQWGIDFIARNIAAPTVTLHYPTMKQFIAELEKGYDYVGIAFVASTLHKMIPMTEAIREHAPASRIILGGYGTALGEEHLAPYADHICQGEGVAFMRELLGEAVDAPMAQPVITQRQSMFSVPLLGRVGYVFAGLGCPNGCDFCATSHYFKRRHIRILPDGPSILGAIEDLRAIYPKMTDFWLNDEDFLLNEARGRSFLEAVRRADTPPLALAVFSSVKALSQFEPTELVEMGIDFVWVGYEGKRAGYSKMKGKAYRELFNDLHQHGISVMASMIIGFDYQTPEIIEEEFEELMSLRPSISQFLIYGPAPGTPLLERMKAEGRMLPHDQTNYSQHDGFYLTFEHPHISPEEMEVIHRRLYHEEFRRLGPSVLRVAEDYLAGYLNLRDHPSPRVRAKAMYYKENAHYAMTLIPGSKAYVSPEVADWLDRLYQRSEGATGPMTPKERLVSKVVPTLMALESLRIRHDIGQQPDFTRRTWRMGRRPVLQELTEKLRELPGLPARALTALSLVRAPSKSARE
jgi:hypothetical protein